MQMTKIRFTVRADNPRTVVCLLAERCSDCKKNCVSTFPDILAVLDGPECGVSTEAYSKLSLKSVFTPSAPYVSDQDLSRSEIFIFKAKQ